MKLGKVVGRVTFSVVSPELKGGRWLIVNPLTKENMVSDWQKTDAPLNPGLMPVVYDDLGGGKGDVIGYIEGAEAAAPFDNPIPIDAINAAIIDKINYKPLK